MIRLSRPVLTALCCFLLLTIVIGEGSWLWLDYARQHRGAAYGPDFVPLSTAAVPPVGINADLQDQLPSDLERSLDLLRQGGYTWVRQPFPWAGLEPAKGIFAWERWDRLVDAYQAHGLRVLAVLDRPPSWSRVDNNWPNRPPDRLDDFGDFVAAFAARYQGRVDYLQIWDEPNVFPNWGNRAVDPAGYGSLLAVAYQRAKQANPSAVVILAGLAPNAEPGGRNLSDLSFLSALYQAGAARYFDIAAAKPYGLWYPPGDRQLSAGRLNFARVVQWHELMVAHGDGAKPIWAVEFGWNALPAGWSGPPSRWGNVSESDQAAYSVSAIRRARAEWPWLPVLMVEGFVPDSPPDDPRSGFSVVDRSLRPRPVFEAIRALAADIPAGVGFHPAGNPYLNVDPAWQPVSVAPSVDRRPVIQSASYLAPVPPISSAATVVNRVATAVNPSAAQPTHAILGASAAMVVNPNAAPTTPLILSPAVATAVDPSAAVATAVDPSASAARPVEPSASATSSPVIDSSKSAATTQPTNATSASVPTLVNAAALAPTLTSASLPTFVNAAASAPSPVDPSAAAVGSVNAVASAPSPVKPNASASSPVNPSAAAATPVNLSASAATTVILSAAAATTVILSAAERSEGSPSLAAPPGASLRLPFAGTRLDLQVVKGPAGALASVTVDGQPANALIKQQGAAWLDTRDLRERPARVTVAEGLTDGEHKLELTVVSRAALWPRANPAPDERLTLAGFYVVREADYGLLPWLSLGLLALAVALARQFAIAAGPSILALLASLGRLVENLIRRIAIRCARAVCSCAARLLTGWQALPDDRRDLLAFAALGVTLALSYIAPLWLIPLLFTAVLLAMWGQPLVAIFGLIATAPLMKALIPLQGALFTPTEVLVVLVALLIALQSLGRLPALLASRPTRSARPARSRGAAAFAWLADGFNAPILLLIAAALAATLFAQQSREALRELRTVIVEPLVLYILVLRLAPRRDSKAASDYVARLVDVLVIVGVAIALVGLVQYFFTNDVITADGVRRLRAFYGSPNNVGLFLGRIIPLAVCLGVVDRRRRWYRLALPVLLAALLLSFSIGAWLAISGALLFALAFSGLRPLAYATGALAALASGVLGVGAVGLLPIDRVASHLDLANGTSGSRLLLWQSAINMLRDHPILGVGPDNFLTRYRTQYILPQAWREPDLSHPHNLLLDFWLRTGFAGLAACAWLLARYFRAGLALYQRLSDPVARALVLGLLASMVDFLLHGLVDNSLFVLDLALVFWLSLGLLEVLRRAHYNNTGLNSTENGSALDGSRT